MANFVNCTQPTPQTSKPILHRKPVLRIDVRRKPGSNTTGIATIAGRTLHCALGRAGITNRKREGDGATPVGVFRLLGIYVRADKWIVRHGRLPVRVTNIHSGWCDHAGSPNYNRLVRLPFADSHEKMWRNDPLYDLLIVNSHNQSPRLHSGGSAIFVHIAGSGYHATEGCVALARRDLIWLIANVGRETRLVIHP